MLGVAALVLGQTFSVAYHAGPGCPSQAQLEAAIVARAPSAQAVEDAQVRFEVELAPAPGEPRRLRAALDDGSSQDRELHADDCAEAAQSAAVIAAMILASRPPIEPKSEPEAPPSEPHTSRPAPPPALSISRTGTAARPLWLSASAGVGLEGAAAPSPTYAASGSVELGSETPRALAPSLRLTALWGRAENASTPIADARFQLALARLHACALRFRWRRSELRLCAVFEGGALFAEGVNARNERSQTMPWLGAGLGALGGVRLSPRLGLDLAAGARSSLVRDEFVFAPNTQVHQPPVIAWDFRLGLNYRLW